MNCKDESGCDGKIDMTNPVSLMTGCHGCGSCANAYPCSKCERLHWIHTKEAHGTAEPVKNRAGQKSYYINDALVFKN